MVKDASGELFVRFPGRCCEVEAVRIAPNTENVPSCYGHQHWVGDAWSWDLAQDRKHCHGWTLGAHHPAHTWRHTVGCSDRGVRLLGRGAFLDRLVLRCTPDSVLRRRGLVSSAHHHAMDACPDPWVAVQDIQGRGLGRNGSSLEVHYDP